MGKQNTSKQYLVGSLFAGIGGFCSAFKNQGFQILWANENDGYAIKTYKHNFHEVSVFDKPIESLRVLDDAIQYVDVITAGFPCQPFSVAGNKLGFSDPRGKLFFEIVRLLKELGNDRPKILILENVKNLLHHNKGSTFEQIMEEVKSAGYWFSHRNVAVFNTKDYTYIPQNRERLFMVALSTNAFDYNDFKFPEPLKELKDKNYFFDLDQKADDDFYFDTTQKYGKLFEESMEQGNPNSVYHLRRVYVRENKNDVVPTLTANMGEGGHNVPVIKDQWGIRKLTPTECLRLQGFDDKTFSFPTDVPRSQQYKQIGNAVTVPLVERLASECLRLLKSIEGDS